MKNKKNLTHARTSVYNINYHIVWSISKKSVNFKCKKKGYGTVALISRRSVPYPKNLSNNS